MSKILIVDDMIFMRATLKKILESAGYSVVGEAENGEDAIEKYKSLSPDLVTMDITMPKMSGIDALTKIKEIDSKAKVVMISAMGQEANVISAIQKGAKNFIVKPFVAEKVISVIKPLLD